MRRLWQVLAVVVALVLAGVSAFFAKPPAGFVNAKAIELARRAIGGDVEINGPPSFRLSPVLSLRLEDVTINNPTGAPPGSMLHAGTVEIEPTFILTKGIVPSFDVSAVRIDAAQIRIGAAQPSSSTATIPSATSIQPIEDPAPRLREVSLTRATLTVLDAGATDPLKLELVDLRLTRANPDAPIDAEIKGVIGKEKIAGTARLDPLKTILAGGPVKALAHMTSAPARGEFDGVVLQSPQVKMTGKSRIEAPSLEILSDYLGLDPSLLGTGSGSFAGEVTIERAIPSAKAEAVASAPEKAWQVSLKGAQINLSGKAGQAAHKFEGINAAARVGSGTTPLDLTADLTWSGERIEAHAVIEAPSQLMKREKSAISARLSYVKGQLEVKGDVLPGQESTFLGRAKGSTRDLRGLATMAGVDMPVEKGLEQADIDSEVRITAKAVQLWNATLTVDKSTAKGSLSFSGSPVKTEGVAPSKPKLLIGGKLTIDKVDAARYLPRFGAEPPRTGGADPKAKPSTSTDEEEKDASDTPKFDPFSRIESVSLADTLRSQIDQMSGRSPRKAMTEAPILEQAAPAWNEEPISMTGLQAVDLDLDLAVGEMTFGKRLVAVPQLKALLNDGRLTLDGRNIVTHGGKLNGTAQIDSRQGVPKIRTNLVAEGVDVEEVFTDLGFNVVLSGKARMEAELEANGRSEKDLVGSLAGKVKTTTGKASIVGWDLRRDWRSFIDRRSPGPYNPRASTPLDRLTANVKVTEGVAETENVEVKGPDFGHLGKGSVQLLKRQADYRGNLSAFVPPTLDIPFFVSGPWSRLQAGLDENAGGAFRVILSYLGIKWSGSLESVAESDPELDKLTREFVETASAMKTLPAEDAAALQTLQQKLGIKARQ